MSGRPVRQGRDRRYRRHRLLEELRPQRAASGRRGGARRTRRRGPDACRRGRHDDVHDGLEHRGGRRAGHRHRGSEVLLQDPPRRRRGLRDRSAGGHGRRHGDRGLRGGVPRVQRTVGNAVRPGADASGGERRLDRRRQLVLLSARVVDACSASRDDRQAVHAPVWRDEQGLRRDLGRGPQARRQEPEGLLLREADHHRGAPGLAVDRRTAAAAGLLPGDRRRRRAGDHLGGAGQGPEESPGHHRGGGAGGQPRPVFDGQLLPARTRRSSRDGSGRKADVGAVRSAARPTSRRRSSTTTSPRSR